MALSRACQARGDSALTICGDSIRVVHPLFQEEDGGALPTSPLQLHFGEIALDLAIQLNAIWHSRLPNAIKSNMQRVKHLVCFGAEFAGRFYQVSIFTDPVARMLNGNNWIELRRMAIANDAPPNTASRSLRIMRLLIQKKWPHLQRMISYQDCDVHTGTIYLAAGWQRETENLSGNWIRDNRDRRIAQAPGRKLRWGCAL